MFSYVYEEGGSCMHSSFGDEHQRCMEIYGSRTDREREKKRGKEKKPSEASYPDMHNV